MLAGRQSDSIEAYAVEDCAAIGVAFKDMVIASKAAVLISALLSQVFCDDHGTSMSAAAAAPRTTDRRNGCDIG